MKSNSAIVALLLIILAPFLHALFVAPLSGSLDKARSELIQKQSALAKIQLTIAQQAEIQKRITELDLTNVCQRGTWITPMLNSYAMRAKAYLGNAALESGLTNVEYDEGTLRALPVPSEQLPERRTGRRSVRVRASADYAAVASFLLRAERDLPLMSVQALSIKPVDKGSAERQDVTLTLEWPCEGEVIK